MPIYVKPASLCHAVEFLKEDADPCLLALMDVPGIGKTTVIQVASSSDNVLYARFCMNSGLFASLHTRMADFSRGALTRAALEQKLQTVALSGLVRAFKLMDETFRELHHGQLGLIPRNGFEYDPDLSLADATQCASRALVNLEIEVKQLLGQDYRISIHLGMYLPHDRANTTDILFLTIR